MSNYGLGFLDAAGPWTGAVDATISFTDSASSTNNNTTYTFSSLSIGTAATNRVVSVTIYAQNTAGISTVTIGGISATKAIETYYDNASSAVAVYYAVVPTGTTATVVITCADQATRCVAGVYRIIPGYSSTPITTGSAEAAQTLDLTEITGGVTTYLFIEDGTTAFTPTRNSVTLSTDASSSFGGPLLVKYGHISVSGNPNAKNAATYATGTGSNNCTIIASNWK